MSKLLNALKPKTTNLKPSMLTLEKLLTILPLLRVAEIERRCGFPTDKIQNWKRNRSTPTPEELNKVTEVLIGITQFYLPPREYIDNQINQFLRKHNPDLPSEVRRQIALRKEILKQLDQ